MIKVETKTCYITSNGQHSEELRHALELEGKLQLGEVAKTFRWADHADQLAFVAVCYQNRKLLMDVLSSIMVEEEALTKLAASAQAAPPLLQLDMTACHRCNGPVSYPYGNHAVYEGHAYHIDCFSMTFREEMRGARIVQTGKDDQQ